MPKLLEVGAIVRSPSGSSYRVTDDSLDPGGQSRGYFVDGPDRQELFLKMFTEPTLRSPDASSFVARQRALERRLAEIPDFVCRDVEFFEVKGTFYKVSERMTGTTLQDRLVSASRTKDPGFWTLPERLTSARVLAYTVSELHAHGIAHLDLKPANCFLAERSIHSEARLVVRLMDFDGALVDGAPSPSRVLGTDGYWSPEHLPSSGYAAPGKPADVFAMGIMLYEILVGRYPFLTRDGFLHRRADRPSAIAPWLPPAVSDAIWECLNVQPESRPLAKAVHQAMLYRQDSGGSLATASTAPGQPAYRLSLVHSGPTERRVRFHTEGVLGRDRLRGIEGYEAVSHEHARMSLQDGQWAVTALSPVANPLFLNGEQLQPGSTRPLQRGDTLTVGKLRVRVDFEPI